MTNKVKQSVSNGLNKKLIIFDAAGVSWHGGIVDTSKYLAQKYKLPFSKVWKVIDNSFLLATVGKITSLEHWKRVAKKLKTKESGEELEALHLKMHRVMPKVLNFVLSLRKEGYKTLLLTGNITTYIDFLKRKFKLNLYFDDIINSQDIKLSKTDPQMYKYVLKKYQKNPQDVIYIDDLERNLKIAQKLGIKTIRFKKIQQIKKEVHKFLNPIKLVILDCYGIVMNEGYPNTSRALVKKFGGQFEEYQNIMYKKFFNLAAVRKISQKEAWQRTVKYFNLPITWQELRDIHYDLIKLNPRAVRLNKELNQRGYTTLLLTKNTRSQFVDINKKYHLDQIFKYTINTWELNLPKASKKTLRLIMKRFKVKPDEIVYADDQMANLIDAQEMGIKIIFVKNYQQFEKDLKKYLGI